MPPAADPSCTVPAPVHLRPLRLADRSRLAAHLLRLDSTSRRMRFGGVVHEPFLLDYADRTLRSATLVLGLFVEGELRGVAELHGAGANTGELAFSLEADLQGAGHGARLFASLCTRARRMGLSRLVLQCLADNHAMLRIIRRAGATLRRDGAEIEAALTLLPMPVAAEPSAVRLDAARRGVDALRGAAEAGEPALG